MKTLAIRLAIALAALAFVWSCNVSVEDKDQYVSLLAPDSLSSFDTVLVLMLDPASGAPQDTLWNAPVKEAGDLTRLHASHYTGGPMDLLILGLRDGMAGYCIKVEYRNPGDTPVVTVHPAWDTIPPALSPKGLDSLELREGEALKDTGATCKDDWTPAPRLRITGAVDRDHAGTYHLDYLCEDRAGNRASFSQRIYVRRWPDTVAPEIRLLGRDTLVIVQGSPYSDPGAECLDSVDGTRDITGTGTVNMSVRKEYVLDYLCVDAAGNHSPHLIRIVRVIRAPDSDKPAITLQVGDSLEVWQGSDFQDPGADCVDNQDGPLPVTRLGQVDTKILGIDSLVYRCADSAGNVAEARRWVTVARAPDNLKPVLTLRGPDSLDAWEGRPYVDSGAVCSDDRDGTLPVTVKGTIDVHSRGTQVLRFDCTDSAGNAALERSRKVRIIRVPDSVKPEIILVGSANAVVTRGRAYLDSGAVCLDDRDGRLPVSRFGTVDTSKSGSYALKFGCADSAGNSADTVTRTVTVAIPSDTIKPAITLVGPDSIPVLSLSNFDDPGATCSDDRDGTLPASLAGFDPPSGPVDGYYRARYTCTDKAGNIGEAYRVLKSGLYTVNIADTQDAAIDTTLNYYNLGLTGYLSLNLGSGEKWFTLYRFDLTKVTKAGLKSAKLRFVTWPKDTRPSWPGSAQDYSLKVWGFKRDWIEGTGNWFYNRGAWQNSGESYFADYVIPDWVKAASSDPALDDGVTGADRDMVRPGNMTLLASATARVRYDASFLLNKVMAPPAYLRVVEIDVTDYVKNADPSHDYGFTVTCDNCTVHIGVMSKEVNDGIYAPRLMLSY